MKAICDRAGLVDLLNIVGPVALTRTPKAALTCVKITAGDGVLTLAATDLELAIWANTARVEVSEGGEALVPADKLSQIVRESADATLTVEVENNLMHIRGEGAHFQVFGQPPEDFPPLPQFTGNPDFEVEAGELQKLITQTIFATARETSRYAINGVLVEREDKHLTLVATDGRRLAMAKGACKPAGKEKNIAIVPTKALNMLVKLFDDPGQTVRVKLADNRVLFATDDRLLASNLVEGNFPPYKDVIPRDGDKKATLDTAVLASAVRRASLLTNEESKGVRFAFSGDGLTLSSRAPEMGESQIDAPMPQYSGEPIEIGFNPQFVLDALKITEADQVQLELKAPNKPGVMRTGPGFVYVIMPVNLQ